MLMFMLAAAACTTATPDCTERVTLTQSGRWSLVYRTHPLRAPNPAIRGALVVIHGQGRNAHDYFRTGVAAAFLAGRLEDAVVVAPRFASREGRGCNDTLAEGEISHACSGQSWRSGAAAADEPSVNSYDFMDAILMQLADKRVFPNLSTIVVTGHSAGGQYVARYAMANRVHETLGVQVRYVVSNPSSYAYLNATRLPASATCTVNEGCTAKFGPYGEGRNCTTYNNWPYGLEKRAGYTEKIDEETLKKQLASRPVTYLLSELDTLPIAGFDSSCPAMAQGPARFARGIAYYHHVREVTGAKHEVVAVPLCGHNNRCVYTADVALPVLFPRK
jgi:pimeloyl-ACP methyl ester carboxylesterase